MVDQAENTAPDATPEVDSEGATSTGAGSAPAGNAEAPASGDDTSTWTEKAQKRYDELTRERYEAAARADRAEYRLQEAERRLQEREQAAQTQTVAPSNDYPTLESVGWDEDKHKVAVAQWVRGQAGETVKSALAQEREAAQREQSHNDWTRKQQAYIEKNPDYVAKVLDTGRRNEWVATDTMTDVITASDIGPEIAAYLAENKSKSFEIARLPPHLQAREIGRIEARIEAAKASPPPVSKAPPPPAKIDAQAAAEKKDPKDMTDTEWYRYDQKTRKKAGAK